MPQEMKVRSVDDAIAMAKNLGGTLKNAGGAVVLHPEDRKRDGDRAATEAMTKVAEQIAGAMSRIERVSEIQARALVLLASRQPAQSASPPPSQPASPRAPGNGFYVEIVRSEKNDLIEGLIIKPLKD